MTTPVKTASVVELIAGARGALEQKRYDEESAARLEALGKAPAPACDDTHEDCAFYAESGECENNEGKSGRFPAPILPHPRMRYSTVAIRSP